MACTKKYLHVKIYFYVPTYIYADGISSAE